MGAVPAAGHDRELGIGADACCYSLPEGNEFGVVFPGEDQNRHLELAELQPQRTLGSGTAEAKTAGQPRRRIRATFVSVCSPLRQ